MEHDPHEIWTNVREVVGQALTKADLTHENIKAVGITNQRETAVVWDKTTGKAVYNAIVWQDTRTQKIIEKARGRRRDGQVQGHRGPAARHVLRRPQGDVGAG
ncbi:hypothetical protein GCM10025876_03490 [Demequina litorisediminis]|uniref:Carbohydrate kinase FGGY N-terminal domain-containing protein n=1 Tax=Demequina litorisediminis TaxID=1849022 RepID=A0ABQ6I8S4_9MICO|nr:hypothetical protein GCM10025876_03490 [Demequina litorisediminis]